MSVPRIIAFGVALECLAACTGGPADPSPTQTLTSASATKRTAAAQAMPTPPTAQPTPLLTESGVGPIALGTAITEPAGGYEAAYTTDFYADAQPLEGFRFQEPPALVYVGGGPFSSWGYDNPGEAAPESIRRRAIADASAGKLRVEMIVVTDPRLKATGDVGVGSTYAGVAAALPAASRLEAFPGLWEEPSCIAMVGKMWFFFDRCDAPEQAKVIRMVVRTDDQGQDTPSRSAEAAAAPKTAGKRKPKSEGKKD